MTYFNDTIRDAILTCAQKPIFKWHRTEPKKRLWWNCMGRLVQVISVQFVRYEQCFTRHSTAVTTCILNAAPNWTTLYKSLIHRKFGSDTETQQHKHKYKQDTIQNTTIKSITAVDTWYWSIKNIIHNQLCLPSLNYVLQFATELAKNTLCGNVS